MHLPFVLPLHERDPRYTRPMWVVQAGTAVSNRVRAEAGNSVNLFRIDAVAGDVAGHVERSCTVKRWDHNAAAQRFELATVYPLASHKAPAP